MLAATEARSGRSNFAIVAIGVFKLVKSGLLLALGIALVHWRNEDLGDVASRWITRLWLGRSFVDALLVKLSLLSRETIDEFAVGSFVYSALLLVEGVGLCLRKRWAEFLTVGITASLLPFEIYHLARKVTVMGVIVSLANLAVVIYLVARLVAERRDRRAA